MFTIQEDAEIRKIAREQQAAPVQFVMFQTLYAPPKPLKEGMVVLADGTTWNPGSGAGLYLYRGGAWRFLG